MNRPYKYFAFISYSHKDKRAAKLLQRMLLLMPTTLQRQISDVEKRVRIFRDEDELTSGELTEVLKRKLDESKFLIVICSSASASSYWVGEEIEYFSKIGRKENIIPFVINGMPYTDKTCIHKALWFLPENYRYIIPVEEECFRPLRFYKSTVRLMAQALQIDFGTLWDKRKHFIVKLTLIITLPFVILLWMAGYSAIKARQAAPFNAELIITESSISDLPLRTDGGIDTLHVDLEDNYNIKIAVRSIPDTINLCSIPGRYRSHLTRVTFNAIACKPLDTVVELRDEIKINLLRDPEFFGRIRHYVYEESTDTPVSGAEFDFKYVKGTTDSMGFLNVLIPLEYQQTGGYGVTITHQGKIRELAYQKHLDPYLDRTEITTITLE